MCDMVKKYVFTLPRPPLNALAQREHEHERERLLAANEDLHQLLNGCKDQIARHPYTLRRWDACKRVTNEYELVFTSASTAAAALHGVASVEPVSRSFFKLWEMLHDNRHSLNLPQHQQVRAAFLAEGPGGFVECFAAFRAWCDGQSANSGSGSGSGSGSSTPRPPDQLNCITLISSDKSVPGWKVSPLRNMPNVAVRLHHGVDGTGDLYRLANIDQFVGAVGGDATCHLVTADGGFDISSNYNSQEEQSARLIMCETYTALRLQALGGALVMKLFDVRTSDTLAVLAVLCRSYDRVCLAKPLTSRPANSEKYVVCTGFTGASARDMCAIRHAIRSYAPATLTLDPAPIPMLRSIVEFNTVFVARQVASISTTIALMSRRLLQQQQQQQSPIQVPGSAATRHRGGTGGTGSTGGATSTNSANIRHQLTKCVRWCYKYHIALSIEAIHKYNRVLLCGSNHRG